MFIDMKTFFIFVNLRSLRKASGFSQRELADLVGITDNQICNLECGKMNPSLTTIVSLCSILGCSFNDLIMVYNEHDYRVLL